MSLTEETLSLYKDNPFSCEEIEEVHSWSFHSCEHSHSIMERAISLQQICFTFVSAEAFVYLYL